MARPVRLNDDERAALAAADRPIDRAVLLTRIADKHGTLCPDLAQMRALALVAEINEGRKVAWLARQIGRSPALITKITRPYRVTQTQAA